MDPLGGARRRPFLEGPEGDRAGGGWCSHGLPRAAVRPARQSPHAGGLHARMLEVARPVSVDAGEIVDAELVEDGEVMPAVAPHVRLRIDQHTVLRPGQPIPTADDPVQQYTERDLYVSEETSQALDEAEAEGSAPRRTAMNGFETWCASVGRVADPCTT